MRGTELLLPSSIVPVGSTDRMVIIRDGSGTCSQSAWVALSKGASRIKTSGGSDIPVVSIILFASRSALWPDRKI